MTLTDRSARIRFLKSLLSPTLTILGMIGVGIALDIITNAYVQFVILLMIANTVMATSLNLVSGFTGQFSLGHAGFMAVGAYVSAWLAMHPALAGAPDLLKYLLLPIA